MTKKYYPLLGDIAIMQQAERENKFRMQYYIDAALERTDVDLVLTQVGNHIEIDPVSVKALEEFESLVPSKIDRYSSESMPVQRIWRDSFGMIVSNSSWSDRRKTILKIIGINFASQYITMMIKAVDDWTEKLKLNEEVNFSIELNKLAFWIISKILFGRDIEKADKFLKFYLI